MYLVLDAGNSNIVAGIFSEKKGDYNLKTMIRMSTFKKGMTTDELSVKLIQMLDLHGIKPIDITRSICASVVPNINHNITKMMNNYFHQEIIMLKCSDLRDIKILYEFPETLGIDRVVGAKAAVEIFGAPAIVIDFGTATSFNVINQKREFIGGLILPGLAVSMQALVENTSKLPKVELDTPLKLVGLNTKESMQNGVYYMNRMGAEAITERIIKQNFNSEKTYVIAAGGLAPFIASGSNVITHVAPNLNLTGLKICLDTYF